MAFLEQFANFQQLGGCGEVIANVMSSIQNLHQPIPAGRQDRLRSEQTLFDKLEIRPPGNALLNRLAKQQARQEPFEKFRFPERRQIDSQVC
jgi:hypothetical protein